MKLKQILEATYDEHPAIKFIMQTPFAYEEEIVDHTTTFPVKDVGNVVETITNKFGQPLEAGREYPKKSRKPHGKYWLWEIDEEDTRRVIRILLTRSEARLESEYFTI